MSATHAGTAHVIERRLRPDRSRPIAAAIGGAVLVLLLLYFFADAIPAWLSYAVLALFAAGGVFAILGMIFGFVRFEAKRSADTIAKRLLEETYDGVLVTGAGGEVVFANRRYLELLSLSNAEIASPVEHSGWVDAASVAAIERLRFLAERGESGSEEARFADADGVRWLRVEATAMDLGGGAKHTAWSVADVTGDRLTQEASFAAARDAIDYLDRAPAGVFAARPDGVISHINATLADRLGIDLTDFRRRELRVDDLLVDGEFVRGSDEGWDETGMRSVDAELRTADARALPVHVLERRGAAPCDDHVSIVLDRQDIERDYASVGDGSGGAAAAAFSRAPVAMAALDEEGCLALPNAAFLRMFPSLGGGRDERTELASLVPEQMRAQLARAVADATRGRVDVEPIEVVLGTSTPGEERHIRFLLSAGEPAGEGAMVYAIENTEQKAIEAAYVQGQKMQAVGQLAGGLAHDFNNVLSIITMSADMLLESHGAADPSHPDIRNIKISAQKAASLVRQLLAFSRKQTMRPQVLMLSDVLSDARMLLQRLAGEIKLDLTYGNDLWAVRADLGQFEQVVSNLVANARDAMSGAGTITVAVRNVTSDEAESMPYRGLPTADYVMTEVIDTGSGMPAHVQEKVFEPFFTTKDVGKGTGLGLAMVYGIVKQSEGFIFVDSEVGQGTRFRILLPRHRSETAEAVGESAEAPAKAARSDITGSGIVLVVEDEDGVRMGATRALATRGYTVHEAADGEEAMEVLEKLDGKVDLIVSDVVMPEMDGPTLLREMRAVYGDSIKFIFVSGYAEDAFAKNLPAGAEFSFLPKPYSLKDLGSKVKSVLSVG